MISGFRVQQLDTICGTRGPARSIRSHSLPFAGLGPGIGEPPGVRRLCSGHVIYLCWLAYLVCCPLAEGAGHAAACAI